METNNITSSNCGLTYGEMREQILANALTLRMDDTELLQRDDMVFNVIVITTPDKTVEEYGQSLALLVMQSSRNAHVVRNIRSSISSHKEPLDDQHRRY